MSTKGIWEKFFLLVDLLYNNNTLILVNVALMTERSLVEVSRWKEVRVDQSI